MESKKKNILVVSDNLYLIKMFSAIIALEEYQQYDFKIASTSALGDAGALSIEIIDIKKNYQNLIGKFDVIISLHCKQLFPKELVDRVRCINVHPGINPHNRGWFPQVFSIINGLPAGVTIHEMDEHIDHGKIIAQTAIQVDSWDTSFSLYNKILLAEIELIKNNLKSILANSYSALPVSEEGNLNLLAHYKSLCELDLEKKMTMKEALDLIRALTHPPYKNAFFIDDKSKKKVYVSLNFELD